MRTLPATRARLAQTQAAVRATEMATHLPTAIFVLVAASAVAASVLSTERRCQLLCDAAGGTSPEVHGGEVCVCQLSQDVIDLDNQNLEAVKKEAWQAGLLFVHVPQGARERRCVERLLRLKAKNAENGEEIMRKKWLRYQAKKHRGSPKILKEKSDDTADRKYVFKGRKRGKGYSREEEEYEKERIEYEMDEKGYGEDEKEYEREKIKEKYEDSERSRRAEFDPVTKKPLVVPHLVPRL